MRIGGTNEGRKEVKFVGTKVRLNSIISLLINHQPTTHPLAHHKYLCPGTAELSSFFVPCQSLERGSFVSKVEEGINGGGISDDETEKRRRWEWEWGTGRRDNRPTSESQLIVNQNLPRTRISICNTFH